MHGCPGTGAVHSPGAELPSAPLYCCCQSCHVCYHCRPEATQGGRVQPAVPAALQCHSASAANISHPLVLRASARFCQQPLTSQRMHAQADFMFWFLAAWGPLSPKLHAAPEPRRRVACDSRPSAAPREVSAACQRPRRASKPAYSVHCIAL